MKTRLRSTRLAAGLLYATVLCLLGACVSPLAKFALDDRPTGGAWGQVRYNRANTAFVQGPVFLPECLLWEAKTGGEVRAELVADRGIIIASCWDGKLYFFDAETGKRIHREDFNGPPTSIFVAGDSLVFAIDAKKPKFLVWDLQHQTKHWETRITRPGGPPLRVARGWLVPTLYGGLSKLDDTGEEVWSHQFKVPLAAKPALAGDRIYFVTGGKKVTCLDADSGTVIWDHSSAGSHAASPAVDGMVYFGSLDSNFYALSVETGEMRWFFHTNGQIFTSPAVDGRRVYFGSNDGFFYALDKQTGRLDWKLNAGLVHNSSPAVWGSIVIFGTSDGRLLSVDSATGQIQRQFHTRGGIYNAPIIYRNKVYVTDTKRRLYCFGTTEETP